VQQGRATVVSQCFTGTYGGTTVTENESVAQRRRAHKKKKEMRKQYGKNENVKEARGVAQQVHAMVTQQWRKRHKVGRNAEM